jgi:vacuolar-type H+-ATPase subunit B/Vma2
VVYSFHDKIRKVLVTVEELKALSVGSLVKIRDDAGNWEIGEILKTGQEVTVMWPDSKLTQYVGLTKSWESFINWLEVEE